MTKTEVRSWIKRIREDLRDAERALLDNDESALHEAMQDAGAASCEVEYATVRGMAHHVSENKEA